MQRPWVFILNIGKPLPKQSPILMEHFGPSSNWKANHVELIFPIPPILENQEDPIILSYICGP
jgi:hypothetical protein